MNGPPLTAEEAPVAEPGQIRFRFPLCFLAYGPDPKSRLSAVIDHCVIVVGRERHQAMDAQQIKEAIKGRPRRELPGGLRPTSPDHQIVVLGQEGLGVQQGNVDGIIDAFRAAQNFLDAFTAKHGKQPYVSIGGNLVWEIIHGSGISWPEFSVLCGLYSWIGGRKRAWVTRSVIACRAMGYKSASVMEAELPNRTDGAKPLTIRQTNYILDQLDARHFFARVRRDPWHTYYSLSIDQDALEKALLGSATYESEFHQRRVARSTDFMERLKAARRANVNVANVDKPNVDDGQESGVDLGSRDVHAASTPASTPASTGVSTLAVSTSVSTVLNPCTKPLPLLHGGALSRRPPQGWQLLKDAERLKKQLQEARDASDPDEALIAGLRAELQRVKEQIRNLAGRPAKTASTMAEVSKKTLKEQKISERESMAAQVVAAPIAEVKPPPLTLETLTDYLQHLDSDRAKELAQRWWAEHGADPRWKNDEWRDHVRQWFLDQRPRRKAAAK